jgi:hypothetical protein
MGISLLSSGVKDYAHAVIWPGPSSFHYMGAGSDKALVSNDEACASRPTVRGEDANDTGGQVNAHSNLSINRSRLSFFSYFHVIVMV